MKKILIIASVALLAACSPQIYPLTMMVRQPSKSGIDLARKDITISYMDSPDSSFNLAVASAMARSLEEDYFGGQEVIGIYRIPQDSVSLDLMHSLVMETGGDVVFLLSGNLGEPVAATGGKVVQLNTILDVYDSMGKDKVKHFKGSAKLTSPSDQATDIGERISSRFLSEWVHETFSFYYYDDFSFSSWVEGLQNVADAKFSKAVDSWAPLARDGSNTKKACACYNIAMAFYLMEDYSLSSRWLDLADKMEELTLSPGLRKRINSHLEKLE